LSSQFPKLDKLNSLFIAVNQEYAADDKAILVSDEIALIPPVSGG
jgi:molybdopterin converting factor small subunit